MSVVYYQKPEGGTAAVQTEDSNGNIIPFDVPDGWVELAELPPIPLTVETYQVAIQSLIDDTARTKLYHDGVTMASYVNSTVEPWAAQAQAFVAWRDAVWQYSYAELDKVQAGERDQPAVAAFLSELPQIAWPQ